MILAEKPSSESGLYIDEIFFSSSFLVFSFPPSLFSCTFFCLLLSCLLFSHTPSSSSFLISPSFIAGGLWGIPRELSCSWIDLILRNCLLASLLGLGTLALQECTYWSSCSAVFSRSVPSPWCPLSLLSSLILFIWGVGLIPIITSFLFWSSFLSSRFLF